MNPLIKLSDCGQSFWYDNIRRSLLLDGTIEGMIRDDGLRGMTSNPSIFEKAIGAGNDYDGQIRELASKGLGAEAIYEQLAITDIEKACDLFEGVYQESDGRDGYVSLEVSPHLALDEDKTVAEAKRLFKLVGRPNLMIKVPATDGGVRAVKRLISQGVNVNVTLMFSMRHYEAVANAYIDGMNSFAASGDDVAQIASVASFFVSRVDTSVDLRLGEMDDAKARALQGRIAVANSKLVYQRFKELFQGAGFDELHRRGARAQRLLWASTSTKNPAYPDTLYVDELIGPDTVNTMPPKTIGAFRDHGRPEPALSKGLEEARQMLSDLDDLGIDLNQVTEQLQIDGIKAFADSYDQLLQTVAAKAAALQPIS